MGPIQPDHPGGSVRTHSESGSCGKHPNTAEPLPLMSVNFAPYERSMVNAFSTSGTRCDTGPVKSFVSSPCPVARVTVLPMGQAGPLVNLD